ncbi:hypothetical protein ACPA54_21790 [Uniformispora flossi]|uniref:hypothetical protein n=1 Tax=Uniformispora flossi TaxID=3390723 RepID=UPI003C2E1E30
MPRTKRAAVSAACALGVAAAMTATAQPASAAGHGSAYYTCYYNYPVNGPASTRLDFLRSTSGYLKINTVMLAVTNHELTPADATGSLFWGPTPTITGMGVWMGVGAPVYLDQSASPALPSAPLRIDITSVAWSTVTSCYLSSGSSTGFPI